jgi:hypothetical protein
MTAMILFQSQPQFKNLGKSEEVEDARSKPFTNFNNRIPTLGTARLA